MREECLTPGRRLSRSREVPIHSSLAHLPHAFWWVFPELQRVPWPEETRATCASCPMGSDQDLGPGRSFDMQVRCCTYHPTLPNHLVGRILRDGGPGAERMRARLADSDGVEALGVAPPLALAQRMADPRLDTFGRDLTLTCPYWIGGTHACSIWAHRGSVCRTWFCRVVGAQRGLDLWREVRTVLKRVEDRLAALVVSRGQAPEAGAGPEAWEAWFRWCADEMDRTSLEDLHSLRDPGLVASLKAIVLAANAAAPELPERPTPSVSGVHTEGETVWVAGYSVFDPVKVDRRIFLFLSLLDGERTWKEALAESDFCISKDTLLELWRVGALSADPPGEVKPGVTVIRSEGPPDLLPKLLG